jgi:rhodanese-related sulfurtransferase
MPLNDDIIIYPAHGAGSACGKNMSKETTDTLGNQKKYNYALRANMTRDEFIKEVTNGLLPPPAYFPMNVKMNKEGYESIDDVISQGTQALSPEIFETIANETGAVILDTRNPDTFGQQFIPNAINIGLDGNFAPWVGALITDIKQPILIIADDGNEEEVVTRLARVGYDHTLGYLKDGINAWKVAGKETDQIASISAEELAKLGDDTVIIDVRKASEYASEHVIGAENIPLDYINDNMAHISKNKTAYVHCAGGYRSMIFNAIMRARGYNNLVNVTGGFTAIKDSGKFNVSPYVCPSTLL